MATEQKRPWFIYHKYGDKMVMDEADHIDHLRQHHKGDKNFHNYMIAGVREPLSDKTLAMYEKQYNLKFDNSKRPALKEYQPKAKSTRRNKSK